MGVGWVCGGVGRYVGVGWVCGGVGRYVGVGWVCGGVGKYPVNKSTCCQRAQHELNEAKTRVSNSC